MNAGIGLDDLDTGVVRNYSNSIDIFSVDPMYIPHLPRNSGWVASPIDTTCVRINAGNASPMAMGCNLTDPCIGPQ